jgi:hypothetical protein
MATIDRTFFFNYRTYKLPYACLAVEQLKEAMLEDRYTSTTCN